MPIWQEMYDANPNLTVPNMSYGVVHEPDLVVFKGVYHANGGKLPKWGNKFKLTLPNGVEKEFGGLTSSCTTAFTIAEHLFNKFLKSAGILDDLKGFSEKLLAAKTALKDMEVQELNGKHFSADEEKARASLEKMVKKHEQSLKDTHDSIYSHYEECIGNTRYVNFERVLTEVLKQETTHERYAFDIIGEAFLKGEDGKPTDQRRADLDTVADDAEDAVHVIVFRHEIRHFQEQALYVKDKSAFERARVLHRIQVMGGEYGCAEAQLEYMEKNLRLPKNGKAGVNARILLGVIRGISEHMYLLPTLKQHPELINDPEVPYANIPFTNMKMCNILKRAMPVAARIEYKKRQRAGACPLERDPDEMARVFDEILSNLDVQPASSQQGGGGGGGGGNGGGVKSAAGGKGAQKKAAQKSGGKSKKSCNKCKAGGEKDNVVYSHDTAECTRYSKDGTQ